MTYSAFKKISESFTNVSLKFNELINSYSLEIELVNIQHMDLRFQMFS